MLFTKYMPEIVGVLILMMMATQVPAIGPILIVLEFALVGLLFLFHRTVFLETMIRWWPVLLAPIIAVVSALWSESTMISLRYGAQFLFTAFVGVLLARLMTPKRFICTLLVAMFLFCIACILYGRQGVSFEGMVLIGLTGSKNQLGNAAQLMLLSGLAVLFMRQISPLLRWIAVLSLPIAAYLLLGVDSAAAFLGAIVGSFMLIGFLAAQRLPPSGRLAAIVAAALVAAPLSALTPEIIRGINTFVFDTLDKSPTLTGRTQLWAHADDLAQRRPFLGYGYQAIWLGESTDTIALRRATRNRDGRSFNFHDQFRQIAVDTGWLGLAPFIVLIATAGLAALRQFLLFPTLATSFFFTLFILTVGKFFFEVILGPFSVHAVMFYVTITYAFWRPQEAAAVTQAMSWRRLQRVPA